MKSYPVPTRVAVEVSGYRFGAYVEAVDDRHVWVHVAGDEYLPAGSLARLTFRIEGGPSLGMTGAIVHAGVDAVGVRMHCDIDLAILAAWAMGSDADLSPSRRVFTSESPTASLPGIPSVQTQLIGGRRRPRDTLQDFVFSLPPA
ncbi:MAG: hypothetical protein RMA76_00340 [Deltaproteobacteria bacterium]